MIVRACVCLCVHVWVHMCVCVCNWEQGRPKGSGMHMCVPALVSDTVGGPDFVNGLLGAPHTHTHTHNLYKLMSASIAAVANVWRQLDCG